jgi:hypothetical protein
MNNISIIIRILFAVTLFQQIALTMSSRFKRIILTYGIVVGFSVLQEAFTTRYLD